MENVFWVGIRESDIKYAKNLFKGAILLFGKRKKDYYIYSKYRANQNYLDEDIIEFYKTSVNDVISEYPDSKFVFYNQKISDHLPDDIKARCLYYVDNNIRTIFADKISSRHYLEDILPSPSYIEAYGCDISFNKVKQVLKKGDVFLVQKCRSGGGVGTSLLCAETDTSVFNSLKDERYLVSPYLDNALSINLHLIIKNEKFKIYPGSVQIIDKSDKTFKYIGADFKAYLRLKENLKKEIIAATKQIALRMIKHGYEGACGIDYLIDNDKLYFCEINTRFQGSTMWLDCLLTKNFNNSFYYDYLYSDLSDDIVIKDNNVSGLFYYGNNPNLRSFFNLCKQNTELCEIDEDGYTDFNDFNARSYLFRVTFFRNITWKSDYEPLRLFENLNHTHFKPCKEVELKIALLACGIRLCEDTDSFFYSLKEGVFSSIDLQLSDGVCVNAPYKLDFSELSPFGLTKTGNNFYLTFYDTLIEKVDIEFQSNAIYNQRTRTGMAISDIFYLATDRIRIKIQRGCDLKSMNMGCKFCNVAETCYKFDESEITENLKHIEAAVDFRHYMIGGGSDLTNCSWDKIKHIASAIKKLSGKEVTLMSIAPDDIKIMQELKTAGIDDVSFNLEVCDDSTAKKLMPYKGFLRQEYINRLKNAVQVWGKFNVRSILLVGLEPDDRIFSMVDNLCRIGVQPVLSVFRPLKNSELEEVVPLDSRRLYQIYIQANSICNKYGTQLGPHCNACKNNTLSY